MAQKSERKESVNKNELEPNLSLLTNTKANETSFETGYHTISFVITSQMLNDPSRTNKDQAEKYICIGELYHVLGEIEHLVYLDDYFAPDNDAKTSDEMSMLASTLYYFVFAMEL